MKSSEVLQMPRLQTSGAIPPSLGALTLLKSVNLGENQLTGEEQDILEPGPSSEPAFGKWLYGMVSDFRGNTAVYGVW